MQKGMFVAGIKELCVSLKKSSTTTEKNLCENEKIGKFEENIVHMLMTFEEFENANTVFQRLLNDIEDLTEIKNILVEEMNKLPETNRYDFLRHISTLFLNIYLNGYKYGEKGKEKSTDVRRIIYDLIIENNY
jgi:hypothetical protein